VGQVYLLSYGEHAGVPISATILY